VTFVIFLYIRKFSIELKKLKMFLKLIYFKRTIYNIPLSVKDYIKVLYFTLFNFKKTLYNKSPYFKDYI